MHTLRVTGIDAQGHAEAFGFGILMNVDNSAKYGGFVQLVNGQARVSVPTGHYAAVFDDFTIAKNGRTTDAAATIPTYLVAGDGQTLTYDMRRSTVVARVTVPKPLTSSVLSLTYSRAAPDGGSLGAGLRRHRRRQDQPDAAGHHRQPADPGRPDRVRWPRRDRVHLRHRLQPRLVGTHAGRPRHGGRPGHGHQ